MKIRIAAGVLLALLGQACSWAPTRELPPPVLTVPAPVQQGDWWWPLSVVDLSSGFRHPRPSHRGVDLRAPRGTPVHVAASGKVVFSGTRNGYGKVVIVEHPDRMRTLYAHNERNLVTAGDHVQRGTVIATVGRSGNATGYHVHFEVIRAGRHIDPASQVNGVPPAGRDARRGQPTTSSR